MRYSYCYMHDGLPQSIQLEPGVTFTKPSGKRYTILALTNLEPGLPHQPVSVVYQSEDKVTYCAPVERALRGVTTFQAPLSDQAGITMINLLDSVPEPFYSLRDPHLVLKVLALANQTATLPEFPLQCVFSLDAVQLYSMPYSLFMSHFATQESTDACSPHPPDSS